MNQQINTTTAATDRTKASVVTNTDTGSKNIVMKGPLAEIITKSLNELYKYNNGSDIGEQSSESVDPFGVSINGKRIYVDKEEKGQIVFYAIFRSLVNTTDLITFKDLLDNLSAADELVLGCISDTEEYCPAADILIKFANNFGITIYDSIDVFFDEILGKKTSEEDFNVSSNTPMVDLSTEALDSYQPNNKTRETSKVVREDPKTFLKEANRSLDEIEALSKLVKEQSRIYNEWSLKAAHALARAEPEEYERISTEILAKRPKSPAELIRDKELDWPGVGSFHVTGASESTQNEPVFTIPSISSNKSISIPLSELNPEEQSLFQKVRDKAINLYKDIASYLTDDKTEEELEQLAPIIKEKAKASNVNNKARFYTHPKVNESTNTSFFKRVIDYLKIMAKYSFDSDAGYTNWGGF